MKSFYLFVFFFISTGVFSQNTKLDSLQKILKTQGDDTNKVNMLIAIGEEKRVIGKNDEARKYTDEALALSEKISYSRGKASAWNQIGRIYNDQSDFNSAFKYLNKSLALNDSIENKAGVAENYINLNRVYFQLPDYPSALDYSQKGLSLYEVLKDSVGIATGLRCVGWVNYRLSDNTKATEYFQKSLAISRQIGYISGIANCLAGLGNVSSSSSGFDKALEYYLESLKLYQQLGDKNFIKRLLHNIGDMHRTKSNINKAFEYYRKALAIAEETGNKYEISSLYMTLGYTAIQQGNKSKALKYFTISLNISKEIGALGLISNAYSAIAYIHGSMNNFKEAYNNYLLYMSYKDSVFNHENEQKIAQLQMQYQFNKEKDSARAEQEKKDILTNAEINRQKVIRNYSITGSVAILFFGGFAFYNFRKRKKLERQQALADERLRISRDLHDDMGASLSSISVFSSAVKQKLNNNEIHEAHQLLERMSTDAQEMVSGMSEMVWTINPHNDTIEKLTDRLQVYAAGMLTAKNISFLLECEEELKTRKLTMEIRKNVFLILKEAINNAAKYSGATEVKLTVSKRDNRFVAKLSDNGSGFVISSSARGNGLKNMHQRADEIQSHIEIISEINKGTSVTFECSLPKIGEE